MTIKLGLLWPVCYDLSSLYDGHIILQTTVQASTQVCSGSFESTLQGNFNSIRRKGSNSPPFRIFEVNLGIICASLSTLKAFIKRYIPAILPSSHPPGITSQSHKRSMINPHSASRHHSKPSRKWPTDSNEEELTGAVYLELGEHSKSDQSYAITEVEAKPRSS